MIPSTTTITQIDELPGEEIEFSIGDPRWVMRTQADLYSNRELAVVREYSTNAADANRERALRLGIKPLPIEVTLPSTMNPYFTVRDFGDGMSRDVLAEVYTKFGESTKRDSNEYNGMLGYGSKSAVAYTSSFTVTSVHEGIKTVAVITRKPDWSIVMKIVSQVQSDAQSGTEVKVPVHNADEFSAKAKDFYKFWLPGTVLVNKVEPKHHAGRKIVDGLFASQEYGNSYVVMGNVPYRIENPQALFAGSKMRYFHFVAYVNNGDVEFTPSREALKYTQQTKDALREIFTNLEKSVLAAAEKDIASAKSHSEAFTVWNEWRNSIGFGMFDDLTYKGEKLEHTFAIKGYSRALGNYGRGAQRINRYEVMAMPNTIVVTEFFIDPSSNAKRKVVEYAKMKGWTVNKAVFTASRESDINSKWIPRDKFVTWETLKKALPKKQRPTVLSTGRPTGSWDYYEGYTIREGQSIPAKGSLYYLTVQESKAHRNPHDVLVALGIKDGIVIRVPQNRLEKFKRDYPHIKNLRDTARDKVEKDGAKLLSDDAKEILDIHPDTRNWFERVNTSGMTDPHIKSLASALTNEDALLKPYRDNLALAKSLGLVYYVNEYRPNRQNDYIREKYPLASGYNYGVNQEHVKIYVNAVYAAEMEKKKDE